MRKAWQHSTDRVAALDGMVGVRRGDVETRVTAAIQLDPHRGPGPTMVAYSPSGPNSA